LVYASIGNRDYPYNAWWQKRPEYAWDTLEYLGQKYNNICRVLRNVYKWSPLICDKIEVYKLIQIIEETEEDNKNGSGEEQKFNY
jgi:hypothetical protein